MALIVKTFTTEDVLHQTHKRGIQLSRPSSKQSTSRPSSKQTGSGRRPKHMFHIRKYHTGFLIQNMPASNVETCACDLVLLFPALHVVLPRPPRCPSPPSTLSLPCSRTARSLVAVSVWSYRNFHLGRDGDIHIRRKQLVVFHPFWITTVEITI